MNHEQYAISFDTAQKGVVYCANNTVNGKVYVGYTQSSLYRRKISHYAMSRQNTSLNYFKLALAKYQKSDFVWFVLFKSDDLELLKREESRFIELFRSHHRVSGYNLSSGGEECHLNDEVKEKISKKAKERQVAGANNPFFGKHHSDEQRAVWSESRKGICFNPGYSHSDDTKAKISAIRKEVCKDPAVRLNISRAQKSKPVICVSSGVEYYSAGEAARAIGAAKCTIQAHLHGRNKSVKGLKFVYK